MLIIISLFFSCLSQALVATGGTKIGTDGPFARYFYYNNPEVEDVTWIPLFKLPKPIGVYKTPGK